MVVPGVGASPTELCESSWGTTKQLLSTWREHNLKDPAREMLKQARELLDRGDDEDKRQAVIFLKLAQQYESGSSKEITDLLAKLQKEHGSMRGDEKHDVR